MEDHKINEFPRPPEASDWAQDALVPKKPPFSANRREQLLAFGLYVPLVARINALLPGDFSALPIVAVFGLGALLGLLGFVRLLNRALKRRRAQVMYAVLGMMAASLYTVVMGPTTLDVPQPTLSAGNFSILWFLIGCGVIAAFLGFERAANRKAARR